LLKIIFQRSVVIAVFSVSLAYILGNPKLLLKKLSGNFYLLSYFIFWPYFLLNTLTSTLFCFFSKENVIDEIIPNLCLGRRLWPFEIQRLSLFKIKNTLDLTAEFNEVSFIRNHHDYLCLPILNTLALTVEQLEQAVSWIMTHLAHEGVFVHCALGHGRSIIIIAGFFLESGMVKNSNEAINFVKSKRKNLHLSFIQRWIPEQYQQNLESK